MPKRVPSEIKLRVAVLIGEKRTGAAIVETIAQEFDGYQISTAVVSELRAALNMRGRAGRPVGIKQPKPKTSENRERARQLRADGLGLVEIAAALGISRQRVHKLLTDG